MRLPKYKFNVHLRFQEFWNNFPGDVFRSPFFLVYGFGYLFSFFALSSSVMATPPGVIALLIIFIFFWHKITVFMVRNLKPPPEILILLFLFIYFLQYLGLFLFVDASPHFGTGLIFPSGFILIIPMLWSFLLFTLFSWFLTQDRPGRVDTLLWYFLLAFIGYHLLRLSDKHFWYLLQFIILLFLFRKTAWTESLTRIECWIYFGVILMLFLNFRTVPYLEIPETDTAGIVWYFFPKILSHFFKLYILAVLLKIPFVLVYHHASLNRKLRIAGWLQTSIPQFIQLIILLLVFYFFISSWQAGNLSRTLAGFTSRTPAGKESPALVRHTFDLGTSPQKLSIPGYEPVEIPEKYPDYGVIRVPFLGVPSRQDFFLFFSENRPDSSMLQLIKIDTLFLKTTRQEFIHIAANGILAYPFSLNEWDSVLYKIRGWEGPQQSREFRVFPFTLIPESFSDNLYIDFKPSEKSTQFHFSGGTLIIFGQDVFTAGRVYSDLYDHRFRQSGLWAFDIVIVPDFSFFTSSLARQFLFWLVIYSLINFFVIQRVIKFGNQINQIILQKFGQLTQGIRQISSGNLDYRISMEGEDEFVELAERFNLMGSELQKKISEVREKDRLEYELRIARDVQLSLLPQTLPFIAGYQLSATIQTATEVGGDFYDVLPLDENHYLLVIGDVSGKGTSAAFYMAQCISLIRFARQFSSDPREILLRLNHYFSDPMIDKQVFITIVIGLLDISKHRLSLYRAGHNIPYHIPAYPGQPVREIKTSGLGIGLERKGDLFKKTLKSKAVNLKSGDVLFLYTDGISEAASPVRDQSNALGETRFFGEERLRNVLEKTRGRSPREIQQSLEAELQKFYGKSPLIDDITMLILQRNVSEATSRRFGTFGRFKGKTQWENILTG